MRETSGGTPATILNASGYVTARRQATVSSKVTGKVVEVLIEEGMSVKENQVLARLDDSNAQANLRLVAAQLQSAKSTLSETQVRLQEAEREWKRISGLAAANVASAAELDRADADVKSLKARLERQESEVTVAERQVALWQQQVDDTVIRAPFSGIVVTKNAQPGEMISPVSAGGGFTRTGIGTVVDMTSLEIEVDVNESYINRVEPRQAVVATLDSYPEWRIPAKVIAIVPTADRQKATVKVRIGFDQLDPRILPDMGVKVAFRGGEDLPATNVVSITVPKSAVRQLDGRDVVMIVQNDRVERRAVTVGATRSDDVTIAAGLTAGARVVIEGPAHLAEGDRVREKG
ncbi:MAG TPA: efflux RND transporter periplasmic adaptor subunit, partial [Verrucomicrobiae bacterium]|nr:efflux RND transporter periplasmic adaptor subunit [Verrucomicrobiae bacterium]